MTLLWSWANTYLLKGSSCINTLKLLKGSSPHWHSEDRAAPSRYQEYQGILTGFLPKILLWMLKHSGSSSHLYLVSQHWTYQMGKLCWVNLIKGKKLERSMGPRNRKSGCNRWFLFFFFFCERKKYECVGCKIKSSHTWESSPSRQLTRTHPIFHSLEKEMWVIVILRVWVFKILGLTFWKCTSWHDPSSTLFHDLVY